jgi:MFS family permease
MRPMVLLFVTLFNSILGLSVLFPILGPLGRQLGLSDVQVGALSTGYALMQLVTATFWGRQSDRRGRKPILLVGIVGFAVTFFAFGLVARVGLHGALAGWPLFGALLLTRVVGGAFSSATLPTGQAYAADISGRESRTSAMAVIGMAFGLGIIFGPAIGAGLSALFEDLLAPVYFSAGVAVLNAIFVALRLPEPERHAEGARPAPQRTLARRLWPLLAVGLVATVSSVSMQQTVAFYFQDRLGLDELHTARVVGSALAAYGVVAVLAQGFIVRRFRWPPRLLLHAGLPLSAVGLVLFVFATSFATLTSALVLQGLGQGLLLPGVTAALSLGVDEHEQGSVAGLNSAAQGLGRTVGPLLGTSLYELRHELPYAVGATLLGLVLLAVLSRPSIAAAPAQQAAE